MLVLVVEDDPSVRRVLHDEVVRAGHGILDASTVLDAIAVVSSAHVSGHRIHLAIIDWDLGTSLTGIDVARHVRSLHEGCATLLISGHSRETMRANWTDPLVGFMAFISKPAERGEVRKYIDLVADSLLPTIPGGGES